MQSVFHDVVDYLYDVTHVTVFVMNGRKFGNLNSLFQLY